VKTANRKTKLSIIFLLLSLVFLTLDIPFKSAGYVVGSLLVVVIAWTAILGVIAYLIWRFALKKREGLLLFTFSILFLLASLLQFAVGVFEGYVLSKVDEIDIALTNKSPETYEQVGNLYRNREYNFRIKFPEGWEQQVGDGPHIVRKATNGSGTISIAVNKLPENFSGLVTSITDVYTAEEYREETGDYITEQFPESAIIASGETKISNRDAFWISYETPYSTLDINVELITIQYQIVHNNTFYTITIGSPKDEFASFENTMKLAVSTFVFEDYQ